MGVIQAFLQDLVWTSGKGNKTDISKPIVFLVFYLFLRLNFWVFKKLQ